MRNAGWKLHKFEFAVKQGLILYSSFVFILKLCRYPVAKLLCLFSARERLCISVRRSQSTCWQGKQVPLIFQVSWTATVWSPDRAGTRKTCQCNIRSCDRFYVWFCSLQPRTSVPLLNLKHSLDRRHLDGSYWWHLKMLQWFRWPPSARSQGCHLHCCALPKRHGGCSGAQPTPRCHSSRAAFFPACRVMAEKCSFALCPFNGSGVFTETLSTQNVLGCSSIHDLQTHVKAVCNYLPLRMLVCNVHLHVLCE